MREHQRITILCIQNFRHMRMKHNRQGYASALHFFH
ncbi:hypothetical protein BGLA2_2010002 [Burkholderia gladioli]|nr:hypothetical protein BGLA2_2010002 [Burkholderia gladioli]